MCAFASAGYAQDPARNSEKEAMLWDQLRAINPDLVEPFKQGTSQMDAMDYKSAAASYQKVLDGAPGFDPVYRRTGFCLYLGGDTKRGLALMEQAVKLNRSPENLSILANFLAFPGNKKVPTRAALDRAMGLMTEANTRSAQPDAPNLFLTAAVALRVDNEAEFRKATDRLIKNFPEIAESHYFSAILAATDHRWTEAEKEIHRAEELGLPHKTVEEFLASGVSRGASEWRFATYALYVVVAWIAGLGLLFVSGKVLSRVTLQSIGSSATLKTTFTPREIGIRKVYRRLIEVAGWYYYISLPFVVLLLLAVAGGVFYAF